MLPAPAFAFIDLETTGTSAQRDRITEIGIVRVDEDGTARPRVTEWSSLVDPEVPIPAAIQALTGITNSMVACGSCVSVLADKCAWTTLPAIKIGRIRRPRAPRT